MKKIVEYIKETFKMMCNTDKRFVSTKDSWIMTAEVYEQIKSTIGCRRPEQGGILGSSDGKHIDHYYFDKTADRTSASYTMDTKALNEVIHNWNDNDIRLVGIIHSHPYGITKPSYGDMETAKRIIESIDVQGRFFTPIVQVSPKLNGEITIYPYTFEQTVEMKSQPMEIRENTVDRTKALRLKSLDEKAPNRFARIESVFPENLMKKKTAICIGCGGSGHFLETLARCGVGTIINFDGDVVEDTNIATQGAYIYEIGKYKVDALEERIHNINPAARVISVRRYLDETLTDEEFAFITGITNRNSEDVVILGCTDNFYAQDRCAQLALKYGVPYLAAQIFEKGKGHEVIFSYPGVTKACPRCMLESRYKKYLNSTEKPTGSSAGAAVCVTDYLNSIKAYMAIYILCYNEEKTPFYHLLDKFADRNYLMTKCSQELKSPALESVSTLESIEPDLSFPFVTVAIEQTVEKDCPLCYGTGDVRIIKDKIRDTRYLPKISA